MKLGLVADVHVGNHRRLGGETVAGINRRCQLVIDTLDRAMTRAADEGCAYVVVAGDLFDSSKPEPQVLAAVQSVLRRARTRLRGIVLLVGNHDQHSELAGDNCLGVLRDHATLVEQPALLRLDDVDGSEVELLAFPFRPEAATAWLAKAFDTIGKRPKGRPAKEAPPRIAAVHLGIEDDETAPWLRGAHDSIHIDKIAELCSKHGVCHAFAGNWHDHILWEDPPPVMQIGALAPTGWDNAGLEGYGGLAIFDSSTQTASRVEIAGPRFLKLRAGQQLAMSPGFLGDSKLFVQVTAPAGAPVVAATDVLDTWVERGVVVAGEVLVDRSESVAAARGAAKAARSSESLESAVEAYLELTPLEEGVDRAAVISKFNAYLTKGGS